MNGDRSLDDTFPGSSRRPVLRRPIEPEPSEWAMPTAGPSDETDMVAIGADLAPEGEEGPYLAGFNLVTNLGLFVGPLVVGTVAEFAGLTASAVALGAILIAGVAWIALVIGETSKGQTRSA